MKKTMTGNNLGLLLNIYIKENNTDLKEIADDLKITLQALKLRLKNYESGKGDYAGLLEVIRLVGMEYEVKIGWEVKE